MSRYLTRRANQQHCFIIAKSVKTTAGAQRRLFGVASGETPSPMIGRCIVTASMHRCDPIPEVEGGHQVKGERRRAAARRRAVTHNSLVHCHRNYLSFSWLRILDLAGHQTNIFLVAEHHSLNRERRARLQQSLQSIAKGAGIEMVCRITERRR